jgi:hypothetical protein
VKRIKDTLEEMLTDPPSRCLGCAYLVRLLWSEYRVARQGRMLELAAQDYGFEGQEWLEDLERRVKEGDV